MTDLSVYLLTTVTVSVSFWVVDFLAGVPPVPPGLPVSALMFLAPAVGFACAVGVRTRRPRPTRPSSTCLHLLPWAIVMPMVVFVAHSDRLVTAGVQPTFVPAARPSWALLSALLLAAIAEEVGWSSYLTPRLMTYWSPMRTGIAIGVLWAGLHVIPWLQAGHAPTWVAGQAAFTVVFRMLLVYAYVRSRRRLVVPVVLHVSFNVAWALLPTVGVDYGPWSTWAVTSCVLLAVTLRARPKRGVLAPDRHPALALSVDAPYGRVMRDDSTAVPLALFPSDAANPDVAELIDCVAELERSQRHEDVDGFLALFDDSAIWVTGGGVRLVGKPEIAAFTRRVLPGAFARGSVSYVVRLVSLIAPDVAITGVDQTYLDGDGHPVAKDAHGRPTYVWRRSLEGGWRIVAGQNTGVVEAD